jgi:hypothetical protein
MKLNLREKNVEKLASEMLGKWNVGSFADGSQHADTTFEALAK